jgi:hypothetical protein
LNYKKYLDEAKNNSYALKTCKKHGKLEYKDIGLELNYAHDPIAVTMKCLLCDKENKKRKFNTDNLIINMRNKIVKCRKCKIDKSVFLYYRSELKRTSPACTECVRYGAKKHQDKNKLKKYGITPIDYKEMLISQKGLCKICLQPESHKYKMTGKITQLSVDHCHSTGKVRGLLCRACNQGIGSFNDNVNSLLNAAKYLKDQL